jgi:hypothetical protein
MQRCTHMYPIRIYFLLHLAVGDLATAHEIDFFWHIMMSAWRCVASQCRHARQIISLRLLIAMTGLMGSCG